MHHIHTHIRWSPTRVRANDPPRPLTKLSGPRPLYADYLYSVENAESGFDTPWDGSSYAHKGPEA